MFVGLHAVLAMQTKTPELMINDQEGKDFTKAAQKVMSHYSVQATQKTLDWLAFGGIAVGMYVPRIVAINARHKAEAGTKGDGQVLKFKPKPRDHLREVPPTETGAPPDYVPSVPQGDYGGFEEF